MSSTPSALGEIVFKLKAASVINCPFGLNTIHAAPSKRARMTKARREVVRGFKRMEVILASSLTPNPSPENKSTFGRGERTHSIRIDPPSPERWFFVQERGWG